MKMINYKGNYINVENIDYISKLVTVSTGPLHCDWEPGFKVVFNNGNELEIPVPSETDSAGNHLLSKKERWQKALNARKSFISLL